MLKNSRMTSTLILTVVAAATMLLVSIPAMAQDVANGSATATVVSPLTVTASSPLAFGTVYQGVPKSISKNVADAGVFDVSGQANADLLLYLSLPEFITTSSGDDRMVIAFADNVLDIDTAGVGLGDPTAFVGGWQGEDPQNPMGVAGADPCLGNAGYCSLYLGGKAVPTLDQTAGAYTGDIILTVAYQGT